MPLLLHNDTKPKRGCKISVQWMSSYRSDICLSLFSHQRHCNAHSPPTQTCHIKPQKEGSSVLNNHSETQCNLVARNLLHHRLDSDRLNNLDQYITLRTSWTRTKPLLGWRGKFSCEKKYRHPTNTSVVHCRVTLCAYILHTRPEKKRGRLERRWFWRGANVLLYTP